MGEPSTAPGRVEGGGQPVLSFEQCFILFSSFPLLLAFVVGGLGFEFCVFVAGWRHALRSEWPFIIPGHVQPVGRPCGTWMHYAMRDVMDMGQQMGYRSLEWNWPKEAINRPIWAGIVDGAKLF